MKNKAFIVEMLIYSIIIIIAVIVFIMINTNRIKVIDGCQYIQTYNGQGGWTLTHKGNCTNIIHHNK